MVFFNDTATTEIYTLSLHDALPISEEDWHLFLRGGWPARLSYELKFNTGMNRLGLPSGFAQKIVQQLKDRKSTRLNSSHANISSAVFCLKKKTARNDAAINCIYLRR